MDNVKKNVNEDPIGNEIVTSDQLVKDEVLITVGCPKDLQVMTCLSLQDIKRCSEF
jgi:hypothetical protein